jgi:hypothetical protein
MHSWIETLGFYFGLSAEMAFLWRASLPSRARGS